VAGHSDWEAELLSRRRSKDHQFKHDLDSPLLPSLRDRFTALAYYPPNAALRLPLQLQRNPEPEVVTLAMSTGATRPYLKWGWFEFPAEGQTVRLWAYRPEHAHGEDHLFVPFRDATSEKETYGAGRYLDLAIQVGNEYVVDFNVAYSPYCAYNASYSCPLPPVENWLKVPIRAGEKEFPLKEYVEEAFHA